MKLSEIKSDDKLDEIKEWVYKSEYSSIGKKLWDQTKKGSDIELDSNGEIICHRGLNFGAKAGTRKNLNEIKYPFAKVEGIFSISNTNLTSLKNCPKVITDNFHMNGCLISNFEHAPTYIGSNFFVGSQSGKLTSLKGIHKHIKTVKNEIWISEDITSNILGLIMIDPLRVKITGTHSHGVAIPHSNRKLVDAVAIINKHLNKGKAGVIAAQQELIDVDLEDFAEL